MEHILLKELKETPTEFLKEIDGVEIEVLTEDQVRNALADAHAIAPDELPIEPEIITVEEETDEDETDEENDQESETDEKDEDTDDDQAEQEREVDPDEPTEIEADNFFTAKQAVGLLDVIMVEAENTILKMADVNIKKSDLHYTAKQKKLLETPLEKALKKSKIKISSPWGAFATTFAGIEFAKISGIIANNQIERKQAAEIEAWRNENQQLRNYIAQMQGQLVEMAEMLEGKVTNNNGAPANGNKANAPKRVRNRPSQRKPGENRGRKPKNQTIPLNSNTPAVNQ